MKELRLLDWEYETIAGQYMAPNILKYMNEQLGVDVQKYELDLVYRSLEIYHYILGYDSNEFVLLDGELYEDGISQVVHRANSFANIFDTAWSLVEQKQDLLYDEHENGLLSYSSYSEQHEILDDLEGSFRKFASKSNKVACQDKDYIYRALIRVIDSPVATTA